MKIRNQRKVGTEEDKCNGNGWDSSRGVEAVGSSTDRQVVGYGANDIQGSFRVRSTNFWLNLRDPPPISMKVGTLADNA